MEAFRDWLNAQPAEDRDLVLAATGGDRGDQVLPGPMRVGVAVSGGGDSMALLHLLASAAGPAGFGIEAATVDHRLRPEAAAEAAFVARTCATLGVSHRTLVWDDHPPTGNLMEKASEARRRLLAEWARSRGLARIAMAHTADDQAEGFLMALARGTGLDGLAGMRRDWREDGMDFVRPLLTVEREALRDYLRRHGHEWRDDPTNADDRYLRARARKALVALEPLGIGVGRLTEAMRNLADARRVFTGTLAGYAERSVEETAGVLFLRRAVYLDMPHELRRRLLIMMIRWMSGRRHPPTRDQLFGLRMSLRDKGTHTLGGCHFVNDGRVIGIVREAARTAGRVPAGQSWDNRWQVEGPFAPGMQIGALGEAGLTSCPDWRATGHGRQQLIVSPAVWMGDRLVAAPLAGQGGPEWAARTDPSFAAFAISH